MNSLPLTRSGIAEQLRRVMTLYHPHLAIGGNCCLYCDRSINPRLYDESGRTRHFDHFIPIGLLSVVCQFYPNLHVHNYLIPCCHRCNGTVNDYVFGTVVDKHDYVRDRLKLPRRFCAHVSLSMPSCLLSLIQPIEMLRARRDFIVSWPIRIGASWRIEERILCSSPIPSMEQSKTASLCCPGLLPA